MNCTRLNDGFPFGLGQHFFFQMLYLFYYDNCCGETASEILSSYYMGAPENQADDTNLSEKYVGKQSSFNVASRICYTIYNQNAI